MHSLIEATGPPDRDGDGRIAPVVVPGACGSRGRWVWPVGTAVTGKAPSEDQNRFEQARDTS